MTGTVISQVVRVINEIINDIKDLKKDMMETRKMVTKLHDEWFSGGVKDQPNDKDLHPPPPLHKSDKVKYKTLNKDALNPIYKEMTDDEAIKYIKTKRMPACRFFQKNNESINPKVMQALNKRVYYLEKLAKDRIELNGYWNSWDVGDYLGIDSNQVEALYTKRHDPLPFFQDKPGAHNKYIPAQVREWARRNGYSLASPPGYLRESLSNPVVLRVIDKQTVGE